MHPTPSKVEKLFTAQGWDEVAPAIRSHIIEYEPEIIPREIMALCPGKPLEALHRHLGYDPRTFVGIGHPVPALNDSVPLDAWPD